jgi:hypothetical protein
LTSREAWPDVGSSTAGLRDFIYEQWTVIQPNVFPGVVDLPRVRLDDVTPREAMWFLNSVAAQGHEPPLFIVEDDNKDRCDRCPPNVGGAPRGGVFFERSGDYCTLRLETIVHQAATWRLRSEFGWPRDHLVVESPDVVDAHGRKVANREWADILALETPCPRLPSKMTVEAARSRVVVEAKADTLFLDRLFAKLHACEGDEHAEHNKCLAMTLFSARLFLGVAAGEDWRLFLVEERDGRAILGEQCDLSALHCPY